jgi:hypothetical protein
VFHPGGPASGSGTAVGGPNNNLVNGKRIFDANGGVYAASDIAINTAACTDHAATATHMATLQAFGCWTRGSSVILPPDLNTFGNMPKAVFDSYGYWNLDFSVTKRQRITERFSAEFRVESYNTLNHPNFTSPSSSLNCTASGCSLGQRGTSTPDVGATNPILGSGGPRRFQMGIKIMY